MNFDALRDLARKTHALQGEREAVNRDITGMLLSKKNLENKEYLLISSVKDDDGKPLHSNEAKREAAAAEHLRTDNTYIHLLTQLDERQQQKAQLEQDISLQENLLRIGLAEAKTQSRETVIVLKDKEGAT